MCAARLVLIFRSQSQFELKWCTQYQTRGRLKWCKHYQTMGRLKWNKHYQTMGRLKWCPHDQTMGRLKWSPHVSFFVPKGLALQPNYPTCYRRVPAYFELHRREVRSKTMSGDDRASVMTAAFGHDDRVVREPLSKGIEPIILSWLSLFFVHVEYCNRFNSLFAGILQRVLFAGIVQLALRWNIANCSHGCLSIEFGP